MRQAPVTSIFMALVIGFFCPSPGFAAEGDQALSIGLSTDSDLTDGLRKQLPGIVEMALTLVQKFPPPGYENNLFNWSADRGILEGKTLSLLLTTSHNQQLGPAIESMTSSLDAFTMAPMNQTTNTMSIFLVLLVDRIFFTPDGKERPDSFSRLVVALAHEIYGGVQHFLGFSIKDAEPQTTKDRILMERKAFMASINFLSALPNHSDFLLLPQKTRDDLLHLLPSEIRGLQSWLQAHPDQAQEDPTCQALLSRIRPRPLH